MEKPLFPIAAVIIVLLVVAGIYVIPKHKSTSVPVNSSTPQATVGIQASVKVNAQQIKDTGLTGLEINVKYPQFEGLSNLNSQSAINQATQDLATKLVNQFKTELGNVSPPPAGVPIHNSLDIIYSIAQVNDTIVSIQFSISDFRSGAAHPTNTNQTINYNVSKSMQLELASLFQPGSDYLGMLSQQSRTDLYNQFRDEASAKSFIDPGTTPMADNFKLFLLEPNNLVLVFNPYQVAPNVAGTRKVNIPLTNLKNILNPDYINL